MISKLVTYGKDRNDALDKMKDALDNYVIRGVTHNVSLCHDILRCDKFIEGDMTTNYLYEKYPDGFKGHQLRDQEEENKLASMFAALAVSRQLSQRNSKYFQNNKIFHMKIFFLFLAIFSCFV